MSKIQELQKQLEQAQKEELLNSRIKEMEQVKKEYEGKAYGSHTFERNSAAASMGAVYYEKFFIKNDKIYVLEHSISINKHDNYYKASKTNIQYSRSINERCLTDGKYNASYNLYHGYWHFRKEISVEAFKKMWEGTEEVYTVVKDLLSSNIDKQEWISMAASNNEEEISNCIKDMSIEMIDLKEYPKIHSILEYRTLPMFDRRRWLPKLYAKPILQWAIEQNNKRIADRWCTYRVSQALKYENELLQGFINRNL